MKASKSKAYLKGKKLLSGDILEFKLQDIQGESLGLRTYDAILIEDIPDNLGKSFWLDTLHFSRLALKEKGKIFAVLPRRGLVYLPYEILRENEEYTIYTIDK